ncbi:MAG: hypothetical protein DRQ63_12240, partial [Gammaproteobacteria bacterium]
MRWMSHTLQYVQILRMIIMIKLILFDLDGVLIKTKDIHYEALNMALGETYAISMEEHLGRYDGLPTKTKLEMLSDEKGLKQEDHEIIWKQKQENTVVLLKENLSPDIKLLRLFSELRAQGYKLGCCSNSIRRTVLTALSKIGLIEYFDILISTDDVRNNKPHPEMYWKAMSAMHCLPD